MNVYRVRLVANECVGWSLEVTALSAEDAAARLEAHARLCVRGMVTTQRPRLEVLEGRRIVHTREI